SGLLRLKPYRAAIIVPYCSNAAAGVSGARVRATAGSQSGSTRNLTRVWSGNGDDPSRFNSPFSTVARISAIIDTSCRIAPVTTSGLLVGLLRRPPRTTHLA